MASAEMTVRDQWVDVQGLRIHYLAAGESGSPLVLIHGGGLDSASLSWKLAAGPLGAGHRVFAPDLPGYGNSDKPVIQYTLEYYIAFLERFLETLGLEKVSLAGISLGGAISLGLALRAPERVEKLILVDSHGLGSDIPYGCLGYFLVHLPWINELSWAWLARDRNLARKSLEGLVCSREAVNEALVDEVYRLLQQPGAGAAWRSLQKHEVAWLRSRTDYAGRLPEISAPTLIFQGAEDALVPVAWAERAHQQIPNSQLHIIPGVKHWLPREKPDEFVQLALNFLAQP